MLTTAVLYLAAAAVRGLLVGLVASAALAMFRVTRTSVRLLTWRAVLYAALAMPVLSALLPHTAWSWPAAPVAVSAWPSIGAPVVTVDAGGATPVRLARPESVVTSGARTATIGASAPAASQPAAPRQLLSWRTTILAIYVSGFLFLLARAAAGWRLTYRLEQAAIAIGDPAVQEQLRVRAVACRLVLLPRLAESGAVRVPVTLSAFDPIVVLPLGWREWSAATRDAVLTHELAHIARRDAVTQRLAIAYRAIFWFSPLAWWLPSQLAELAEHASDESALEAGSNPAEYAEVLLGFLAAMRDSPRRAQWNAIAMARHAGARKRIERILAWQPAGSGRLTRFVMCTVMLAAASFATLTASARILPVAPPVMAAARTPVLPVLRVAPLAAMAPAPAAPPVVVKEPAAPPTFAPDMMQTPAATPAAGKKAPCDLCQLLDDPGLVWLKAYAGRTTYEVTQDTHYRDLVSSVVPNASFHFRMDMPLGEAFSTILRGPGLPVEQHNDHDMWVSSCAAANCQSARGLAFLWVDVLDGIGIGGIFFAPTNGEPTPTLTIFSKQQGTPLTSSAQLPPAFLADLARWSATRRLPPAARYFIDAAGVKSVVLHDEHGCGTSASNSPCDATDAEAADKDVDAALFLAMSHDAAGTPAQLALRVSQNAWNTWRAKTCGSSSADADIVCRVQSARDRARALQSPSGWTQLPR